MHMTLRMALLVITCIYLGVVLRAIKHKKMQISLSIFWLLTGGILILALAIPNLIETVSMMLGFELTTNMIFCVTIFIAFYLIFNLTIMISKQAKKNILLIQEISILKQRLDKIEEKQNKE